MSKAVVISFSYNINFDQLQVTFSFNGSTYSAGSLSLTDFWGWLVINDHFEQDGNCWFGRHSYLFGYDIVTCNMVDFISMTTDAAQRRAIEQYINQNNHILFHHSNI